MSIDTFIIWLLVSMLITYWIMRILKRNDFTWIPGKSLYVTTELETYIELEDCTLKVRFIITWSPTNKTILGGLVFFITSYDLADLVELSIDRVTCHGDNLYTLEEFNEIRDDYNNRIKRRANIYLFDDATAKIDDVKTVILTKDKKPQL